MAGFKGELRTHLRRHYNLTTHFTGSDIHYFRHVLCVRSESPNSVRSQKVWCQGRCRGLSLRLPTVPSPSPCLLPSRCHFRLWCAYRKDWWLRPSFLCVTKSGEWLHHVSVSGWMLCLYRWGPRGLWTAAFLTRGQLMNGRWKV